MQSLRLRAKKGIPPKNGTSKYTFAWRAREGGGVRGERPRQKLVYRYTTPFTQQFTSFSIKYQNALQHSISSLPMRVRIQRGHASKVRLTACVREDLEQRVLLPTTDGIDHKADRKPQNAKAASPATFTTAVGQHPLLKAASTLTTQKPHGTKSISARSEKEERRDRPLQSGNIDIGFKPSPRPQRGASSHRATHRLLHRLPTALRSRLLSRQQRRLGHSPSSPPPPPPLPP